MASRMQEIAQKYQDDVEQVALGHDIAQSKVLNYDQVTLIPDQISTIVSRSEIDTSTTALGAKLRLPLLSAPMPDVTGHEMARSLGELGGLGIIHRFQDVDQQAEEFQQAMNGVEYGYQAEVGVAVGLDDEYRVHQLYCAGARVFCVDTANGQNIRVGEFIKKLKKNYEAYVIGGNVASPSGVVYLEQCGCDAIRVGVAPGAACSTARATGIQTPMASTILNSRRVARKALTIADGGIRVPGDFCKALALGADLVMAGNLFAGTDEAPGEVILDRNGDKVKLFRGAASYSVQRDRGRSPSYIEGSETLVPYKGALAKVVQQYEDGLRSCMSYFDSRNLKEFREKVAWQQTT